MNINWQTLYFLIAIGVLLFAFPNGVGNIILFLITASFGIYTLYRMNRKKWENPAITKQERGRGVVLITFYTIMYALLETSWVLQGSGGLIGDTLDVLWTLLESIQGIVLLYLIFQVNLELNFYESTDPNSKEGIITRILKGRLYTQSNWHQSKCRQCKCAKCKFKEEKQNEHS
jgi:CDP-diglyceride synthetase